MRRKPSQVIQADKWTNAAGKPIRNKILLAMTDLEFHVIRPHLEYVALPSHLRLHEPHQTFRFGYFPNEGLLSLVVAMAYGKTVEQGSLGAKVLRDCRRSRV